MTSLSHRIKKLFRRGNGTGRETTQRARLGLDGLENRDLLDAGLVSSILLQPVEGVRAVPMESGRDLLAVQAAKPAKGDVALPAVQAAMPVKDRVLPLLRDAKLAKQQISLPAVQAARLKDHSLLPAIQAARTKLNPGFGPPVQAAKLGQQFPTVPHGSQSQFVALDFAQLAQSKSTSLTSLLQGHGLSDPLLASLLGGTAASHSTRAPGKSGNSAPGTNPLQAIKNSLVSEPVVQQAVVGFWGDLFNQTNQNYGALATTGLVVTLSPAVGLSVLGAHVIDHIRDPREFLGGGILPHDHQPDKNEKNEKPDSKEAEQNEQQKKGEDEKDGTKKDQEKKTAKKKDNDDSTPNPMEDSPPRPPRTAPSPEQLWRLNQHRVAPLINPGADGSGSGVIPRSGNAPKSGRDIGPWIRPNPNDGGPPLVSGKPPPVKAGLVIDYGPDHTGAPPDPATVTDLTNSDLSAAWNESRSSRSERTNSGTDDTMTSGVYTISLGQSQYERVGGGSRR